MIMAYVQLVLSVVTLICQILILLRGESMKPQDLEILARPPKELLKAWTKKGPKRVPKVNDDNSAWRKENNL